MATGNRVSRPAQEAALQYAVDDPKEFHGKPSRSFPGDAGYDLTVCRPVTVAPHAFAQIPTNIKVAMPPDAWGMIVGRSSTFYKRGLYINPSVIDNGYRGPMFVLVYNMTQTPVYIGKGDRIAQLILFSLVTPEVVQMAELPASDRGEKGFGSTGGLSESKQVMTPQIPPLRTHNHPEVKKP